MGDGAYLNVVNNREQALRLYVTNVECMYDNGAEGPTCRCSTTQSSPPAARCRPAARSTSRRRPAAPVPSPTPTFNLKITSNSTRRRRIIGEADFVESSKSWDLDKNTNEDVIRMSSLINNSGDQASITVRIAAS